MRRGEEEREELEVELRREVVEHRCHAAVLLLKASEWSGRESRSSRFSSSSVNEAISHLLSPAAMQSTPGQPQQADLLRLVASTALQRKLDGMGGGAKTLVLAPGLAGPLGLVTEVGLLKVSSPTRLDRTRADRRDFVLLPHLPTRRTTTASQRYARSNRTRARRDAHDCTCRCFGSNRGRCRRRRGRWSTFVDPKSSG
jgi:hypothetical protein